MIPYIKEISVNRFRSIGKIEIPVDNITIFSGKNNSGKSNILKALNLFFNKETSFHTEYNHDVDYNKFFRGKLGGARRVTVKLLFNGIGKSALKDDFWITREFGDGIEGEPTFKSKNENINKKLDDKDGNIIRQFTRFYNMINYVYIPAVRDRNFIKYLFQLFEDIIRADTVKDKQLNQSIKEMSEILQSKANDISASFKMFINLYTNASLSSNMKDILGAVTINVENPYISDKYKKISNVDIFSSGDGILMSYIMYFIAYMSSKISSRYYIWGFEEPETALEYSKAQSLAETFFNDFAEKAQIFITTHSPAFIKLKDKPTKVAFYRVYQNIGKDQRLLTYTQTIQSINERLLSNEDEPEAYKLLQEELHMVEQAKEIEIAVKCLQDQQKQKNDELEAIKKQLENGFPKKIFICEDKKAVDLWASLLNDDKIKVMSSFGCGKSDIELGIEQLMKINHSYSPKVFRTIDRDGYTDEQIKFIESKFNIKYSFEYTYKILPVYEIENFAIIDNPKVTEELWSLSKETIREDFFKTAENNLATLRNLYRDDLKLKLFGGNNQFIDTINDMFKEAEKKWKYLVNGKSMINGIHYDKYIKENTPIKLQELILEIKKKLSHKSRKT
jgi:predicted ATP-dependent endonuclease of OLD family